MRQRRGDRCGGRRPPWAAVVVLVALVTAGCGGGGDDGAEPAEADPTTTASTEAPGSSTTAGTTTTTAPEGVVAVPLDEDLLARLPQLEGGGRDIDEDEAFDERFCDGEKAPAVPKGQARATYPISPTDELTVAAYRFPDGGGAGYLAEYADAIRSCALEVGESVGLGVPELFGSAFELVTDQGDAFMAVALYEDVMWVLFQQSTSGPVEVDQTTYDGFIQTVLG